VDQFFPSAAAAIFNFISTRDRDFWKEPFLLSCIQTKTLLNKRKEIYKSDEIINSVKKTTPTLLIPLAVVCFELAPMAQAVGPDTNGAISGSNNGEGVGVLVNRSTGVWNTGTGFEALNHLTAGNRNTATGLRSLFSDISGRSNTATGVYSLYTNTTGFFNSATGAYSLANNTTGSNNTANGYSALHFNTTGANNNATVLLRSTRTPPAATTPLLGSMPVSIRLRAATISISAIRA
jgi:hypothetical protein